jgi:hypothetical protein
MESIVVVFPGGVELKRLSLLTTGHCPSAYDDQAVLRVGGKAAVKNCVLEAPGQLGGRLEVSFLNWGRLELKDTNNTPLGPKKSRASSGPVAMSWNMVPFVSE